jgi:hypothetical protein
MNLKSLNFWFDNCIRYYRSAKLIPNKLIQLSTNVVLNANAFHTNLIDLNLYVRSVIHLVEIVEQTTNIPHLSINFDDNFSKNYCMENDQSSHFQRITTDFRRLNNLSCLPVGTKDAKNTESYEPLPFNQIQVFIDRGCPNKIQT